MMLKSTHYTFTTVACVCVFSRLCVCVCVYKSPQTAANLKTQICLWGINCPSSLSGMKERGQGSKREGWKGKERGRRKREKEERKCEFIKWMMKRRWRERQLWRRERRQEEGGGEEEEAGVGSLSGPAPNEHRLMNVHQHSWSAPPIAALCWRTAGREQCLNSSPARLLHPLHLPTLRPSIRSSGSSLGSTVLKMEAQSSSKISINEYKCHYFYHRCHYRASPPTLHSHSTTLNEPNEVKLSWDECHLRFSSQGHIKLKTTHKINLVEAKSFISQIPNTTWYFSLCQPAGVQQQDVLQKRCFWFLVSGQSSSFFVFFLILFYFLLLAAVFLSLGFSPTVFIIFQNLLFVHCPLCSPLTSQLSMKPKSKSSVLKKKRNSGKAAAT